MSTRGNTNEPTRIPTPVQQCGASVIRHCQWNYKSAQAKSLPLGASRRELSHGGFTNLLKCLLP